MLVKEEQAYWSLEGEKSLIFVPTIQLYKPLADGTPELMTKHSFVPWIRAIANNEEPPQNLHKYLNEESFKKLFDSIRSGWKQGSLIKTIIDNKGRVIITDGCHRAAIAIVLGMETVPCEVVWREQDWTKLKYGLLKINNKPLLYQNIDHPDFKRWAKIRNDIDERAELIHSLVPVASSGIDFGCNTGNLTNALARLGHSMTGIESDAQTICVAKMLTEMDRIGSDGMAEFKESELPSAEFAVCVSVLNHYLDTSKGLEIVKSLVDAAPIVIFDCPKKGDLVGGDSKYTDPQKMIEWFASSGVEGSGEVISTEGRRTILRWNREKIVKTVGILSPSFSGSTIYNMVLDGLPNVFGAGETHWAVDTFRIEHCREHGVDCPIWNKSFISGLRKNQERWWERIANRAGADTIVSSDKNPDNFKRFGKPDYALVVYKDPRAWVASWFRNTESDDLEKAINVWVNHYTRDIAWLRANTVPYKTFSLETLANTPTDTLKALCAFLEIEHDETALNFRDKKHCQIGGNRNAHIAAGPSYVETFGNGIKVDNRWETELTKEVAEQIINDTRIKKMYMKLQGE